MLKPQEISKIRTLLLSNRVTYLGSEIMDLSAILNALAREEAAARARPAPQTPAKPEGTE